MWGTPKKPAVKSEFFVGDTIMSDMNNSLFGQFKEVFNNIFTSEDIKAYSLPKVVVIGSESTGKSSLLERITKCQLFPRDNKICTKCPIHIMLETGEPKYSITINKNTTVVNDKSELYTLIMNYMDSIPPNKIISKKITVRISEKDIQCLHFIDLPGIRSYPADMALATVNICKKYLRDKNTIVLCVAPATITRLTVCQSIGLISEMGMEQQSILALTMTDRLDAENIEELLVKRILGMGDELNEINFAGCVALVNRTHIDSITLDISDAKENEWFTTNIISAITSESPYYQHKNTILDKITLSRLLYQINNLYSEFINKVWKPKVLNTINDKINDNWSKIVRLGPENITNVDIAQINYYVNDRLNSMCSDVTEYMQNLNSDQIDDENNKIQHCVKNKSNKNNKFTQQLKKHMEIFDNVVYDPVYNCDDETDINKLRSFLDKLGELLQHISKLKQSIQNQMDCVYPATNNNIDKNENDILRSNIIRLTESTSNNNYCGGVYKIFSSCDKYVDNVVDKIIIKIEEIVNDIFDKESYYVLKRFTNLKNVLAEDITQHIKYNKTKNIKYIVNMCRDNIIKNYIEKKINTVRFNRIIMDMIKLLIVYPALKNYIFVTTDESLFSDNDNYKKERVDINQQLDKYIHHYDVIKRLEINNDKETIIIPIENNNDIELELENMCLEIKQDIVNNNINISQEIYYVEIINDNESEISQMNEESDVSTTDEIIIMEDNDMPKITVDLSQNFVSYDKLSY